MDRSARETSGVIRSDRGLIVAGTRITLYDVLDYLNAGWPPKLLGDRLNLTSEQTQAALEYIRDHTVELETEYRQVLHDAEESRHYWETRYPDRRNVLESSSPFERRKALEKRLAALEKETVSR